MSEKIVQDLIGDLEFFENQMDVFLDGFNDQANDYRLKTYTKRKGPNSFHNTFVPETTRAVETLTTTIFRMLTAADPNFDAIALHPDVTSEQLYAATTLLRYQQDHLEFKRKLLNAVRSCVLFGTVVVENPLTKLTLTGQNSRIPATDFLPQSLLNVAFDPMAEDIEQSDWICVKKFISPMSLKKMAMDDAEGTVWNKVVLDIALHENENADNVSSKVKERKERAGYQANAKNVVEATYFWRPNPEEPQGPDWVFVVINRRHLVRAHKTPFNHGIRPFRVARYIEFELEPYGYGVGILGKRAQGDINKNRNRLMDVITFGVYNMMKVSNIGGPKLTDLKLRPFGTVFMNDINAMQNMPAQLEAANFSMRLEEMLKDDYRNETAATASLQAIATDVTATESAIAQSESIRRVAVLAEVMAERLLRKYLYVAHHNNVQFLNDAQWLGITGQEEPKLILPDSINPNVDFLIRLITDKDFKPERARRINEYLQILMTSKSNVDLTDEERAIITLLIREQARGFGLNTSFFPKKKTAIEQMMESQKMAGQSLQETGGISPQELAASLGIPGHMALEPSVQTPLGALPATP